MTDIVERLRRTGSLGIINGGLMNEAAAEIEHLRAEIALWKRRVAEAGDMLEKLELER